MSGETAAPPVLYRHRAPRDRGETEATGERVVLSGENGATEQGWDTAGVDDEERRGEVKRGEER